jgi:ubiquitin-protein ligase
MSAGGVTLAARRLTRELSSLAADPIPGVTVTGPAEQSTGGDVQFPVAVDVEISADCPLLAASPYSGESFHLLVTFDSEYPFRPPTFRFLGTPPLHPHVYSNGLICLEPLYAPHYTPAQKTSTLLLSVLTMLAGTQAGEKRRDASDAWFSRSYTATSDPRRVPWRFDAEYTTEPAGQGAEEGGSGGAGGGAGQGGHAGSR